MNRFHMLAMSVGLTLVTLVSGSASAEFKIKYNIQLPLGEKVLAFAQGKLGQQVGRGECWDLANLALGSAGARQPGQGGYGAYVFGKSVSLSALQPGDILQFENVSFKHTAANGSWSTNNFPHHTAIVKKVTGRQIVLLHQNVSGVRRVLTGTINLNERQAGGTILAYRPQPR